MKAGPRDQWLRDRMPPWAWAAIVFARLAQIVAVLLPLALVVLLWWTWAHRRDPGVRRVLKGAVKQAGAVFDSVASVVR